MTTQSTPPKDPLLGTVFGERYRADLRLGSWRLGTVYLTLEREKCLWTLPRSHPLAALWRRLPDHPHVLNLLDYGLVDDKTGFFVTNGFAASLRSVLSKGALLPVSAVHVVLQLCAAGEALGGLGLRLTDLDLDDVLSVQDGVIRVLPISLFEGAAARRGAQAEAGYTPDDPRIAPYLAPEEIHGGRDRDERADVYAVGSVLFELLTGQLPFVGDSPLQIAIHKVTQSAPALSDAYPAGRFSTALAQLVAHALLADRGLRPESLAAFARNLASVPELAQTAYIDEIAPYKVMLDRPGAQIASVRPGVSALDVILPTPSPPASAPVPAPAAPQRMDDDVQLTLYRPGSVAPDRWDTLLVFMHKSKRDELEPGLDPLAEVARRAEQVLGEALASYPVARLDASASIPRESDITIVPQAAGVRFNPPQATFQWVEAVHSVQFRLRAEVPEGSVVRGRLSAYLGPLLIAEITFSLRVSASKLPGKPERAESARIFQRIFPSYSHKDAAIVEVCGRCIEALGIEYLRDVWALRSGDRWSERLRELIDTADVFQLFWSTNSMGSEFVRAEWEYALSKKGPDFIRPVFWEEPFPEDRGAGLPPPDLRKVHFAKLAVATLPVLTPLPLPTPAALVDDAVDLHSRASATLSTRPDQAPSRKRKRDRSPSPPASMTVPMAAPSYASRGSGCAVSLGAALIVVLALLAWYFLRG